MVTFLTRPLICHILSVNNRCALTDWKGDDDHHKGMNMNEIQAHEDYNHTPDIPEQAGRPFYRGLLQALSYCRLDSRPSLKNESLSFLTCICA